MKFHQILVTQLIRARVIAYKRTVIVVLVLQLATLAFVFWAQSHLPPMIPLLYGKPNGAEQLVTKGTLFVLPALTLSLFAFGTIIMESIKDRFIDQILIGTSFIVSLLSLFATYKIVFLVGSFN